MTPLASGSLRAALPRRLHRDERGVVLLLVLFIIVLTVGSVYAFARTSTLQAIGARHRHERARAQLLARSGFEMAIRALQDDLLHEDPLVSQVDSELDPWFLLGEAPIPVPGGELRVRVDDGGGRVNLNALVDAEGKPHGESFEFLRMALEELILEALQRPGETPRKRDPRELATAILDWIDRDKETDRGDEEADYWSSRGATGPPPDRPLFSVDELATLPGMDGLLLRALGTYFSCQPMLPDEGSGGINPNTAPPHVLAMLYHGSEDNRLFPDADDVFRLLRTRENGLVFCPEGGDERCVSLVEELFAGQETVFPPLQYVGAIFEVHSEARIHESRACVRAVVDRAEPESPAVLYYSLDC